jgi:L-ascorbate metabolism protein UlaG (beta-lactamase superfamily)
MPKSIKWLGHAGFLVLSPGSKTIIIDPWLTDNPLSPIKLADITVADIVLVTHDHFDHIADAGDIAKKTGATLVAVPETVNKLSQGFEIASDKIVLMNIGGSISLTGIKVTMTQAFHSSATGVPCGYIIELEDGTMIYHAGDTGIFDSMELLGELYQIDLALLPIGSVFTMDPHQAAKALALLKPRRVIPMHYKTFPVLEQSPDRFVDLAKKAVPGVEIIIMEPGQEQAL